MINTPKKIIISAYKIIGLYQSDSDLENVLTTEGLEHLNQILGILPFINTKILFDKLIEFNLNTNKNEYVISRDDTSDVINNAISFLKYVSIVNPIDIDNEYKVNVVGDDKRFNICNSTISIVSGRPNWVYLQNNFIDEYMTSTLYFDKKPDIDYKCIVKAKFFLDYLTNSELTKKIKNLSVISIEYLRYKLASSLHQTYPSSSWTSKNEKTLTDIERTLKKYSDKNLNTKPVSIFGKYDNVNVSTNTY